MILEKFTQLDKVTSMEFWAEDLKITNEQIHADNQLLATLIKLIKYIPLTLNLLLILPFQRIIALLSTIEARHLAGDSHYMALLDMNSSI